MKTLIQKAKAFWASLPHPVQALAILFASAALTEGGKIFADFPNLCLSLACLKHDASLMAVAGIVAVRTFYMFPNRALAPQPPEPPEPAKAA